MRRRYERRRALKVEKYRDYLTQIGPTLQAVFSSEISLEPNLEMQFRCEHGQYTLVTPLVRVPLSLNWSDIPPCLHPNAGR